MNIQVIKTRLSLSWSKLFSVIIVGLWSGIICKFLSTKFSVANNLIISIDIFQQFTCSGKIMIHFLVVSYFAIYKQNKIAHN